MPEISKYRLPESGSQTDFFHNTQLFSSLAIHYTHNYGWLANRICISADDIEILINMQRFCFGNNLKCKPEGKMTN